MQGTAIIYTNISIIHAGLTRMNYLGKANAKIDTELESAALAMRYMTQHEHPRRVVGLQIGTTQLAVPPSNRSSCEDIQFAVDLQLIAGAE